MATVKEIENSRKVMSLLSQIQGISFEQSETDPDIFIVTEGDTGMALVLDVEEDIIINLMSITEFKGEIPASLAITLLRANHTAVHGGFSLDRNHLLFKSNLEIANLDLNELEASIVSVFANVNKMLPEISTAVKGA